MASKSGVAWNTTCRRTPNKRALKWVVAVINAVIRLKFDVAVLAEVAHALTLLKLIVWQWPSAFRTFEIPNNLFLQIHARKTEDDQ